MELEFVSEELARDVELFAADYDDVLAIEDLLGDNGGESTCRVSKMHRTGEIPKR